MLALFQCCAGPYFGATVDAVGSLHGPGYKQVFPVVLRVTCPACNAKPEVAITPPSVVARWHLREPKAAPLVPHQVVPGRRVTAEDDASPHRKVKDLSRLQADVLSLRTEAAELQARVRVMVRVRV